MEPFVLSQCAYSTSLGYDEKNTNVTLKMTVAQYLLKDDSSQAWKMMCSALLPSARSLKNQAIQKARADALKITSQAKSDIQEFLAPIN